MRTCVHPYRLLLALLLCLSANFLACAASEPAPEKSLEFVQNKNQWPAPVRFAADLHGGKLYLLKDGFLFNFYDAQAARRHTGHGSHEEQKQPHEHTEKIRAHAYSVTFLGAAAAPAVVGSEVTPGIRNYYIGNDPAKWASEVKGYRQVQYSQLYPKIDLQLYENREQRLKYDFIVQPGGRPSDIRMQYKGMDRLWLENGELHIKASEAKVRELKPYAYQLVNGKQVEVPCRFVLKNDVVTFDLPKGYNKKLPLIIDPTLVYSSFTGSTADNWGFTATFDEQGNMYSGGIVFAAGFPVTVGAYDVSFNNSIDIGIIKYNPNLPGPLSRVYATYLGGTGTDVPHSMVVNNAGDLLILGTTSSGNFPMVNGYDMSFNSGDNVSPINGIAYNPGSDIVISKLNSTGSSLLASTYLGGSGNDGLLVTNTASPHVLARNYGDEFRGDITIDQADNVYIASTTTSTNFPVLNGFQNSYGGGVTDGVVCKFNPGLNSLIWSSYLGGGNADAAFSIQVDNNSNVYVCGGTLSNIFPGVNSGSFKSAFDGSIDGFITKIAPNGSSLVRSTFIGTSSYDQTYFVQLDAFNNVYVLGQTQGNYPATTVFRNVNGRQFIQKLNTNLSAGIFSTTFGSSGAINISPTAFLIDDCERIFACGWGGGTNTPSATNNYVGGNTQGMQVTANAFQPVTDGSDFYLIQLDKDAAALDYATFFGGSGLQEHVDGGTSRFDKRGFAYQAVCANCGVPTTGFPVTPTAFSTQDRSTNCNNAAFKFDFDIPNAVAGDSQTVCVNAGPVTLTGFSPAGGTWSGPGVTPQGVFTPSPSLLGIQQLTYTVTVGNCVSTGIKTVNVVPLPNVQVSLPDSVVCLSATADTLRGVPAGGTFSGPGVSGNLFNPAVAGVGVHQIVYVYSDAGNCSSSDTTYVRVSDAVQVVTGPDMTVCFEDNPVTLTGAQPEGGTWSGPGVSAAGVFTPSRSLIGIQTLTYSVTLNGCTSRNTVEITVEDTPTFTTLVGQPTCGGDSLIGQPPFEVRFSHDMGQNDRVLWEFGDGTTSTEQSPVHVFRQAGVYEVKLTVNYGINCQTTRTAARVTVKDPVFPNIITPNNDGLNDRLVLQFSCLPFKLKIFNRWGKTIFESDDYKQDWDAADTSDGIYYYQVRSSDGRKFKGWFEVVR